MAKPNYSYAKRQRELAKKKKKEEKRRRKSGVSEDPNVESGLEPGNNSTIDAPTNPEQSNE